MTTKQIWNAGTYHKNARFVSDLGAEILAWLHPQPGEYILDLGCGDGALTEQLVKSGAQVVGIDTSPDLLAAARSRGVDVCEMMRYCAQFGSGIRRNMFKRHSAFDKSA